MIFDTKVGDDTIQPDGTSLYVIPYDLQELYDTDSTLLAEVRDALKESGADFGTITANTAFLISAR